MTSPQIDFEIINASTLRNIRSLLPDLVPDGKMEGGEYVAKNPRRADRSPGSFKINVRNGRWGDFATGDVGNDPVSLVAYLQDVIRIGSEGNGRIKSRGSVSSLSQRS